MPIYTYRREDGTTFEIRQSFADDALAVDPATGQKVSRVVHNAGVIFKGSGFYKNDHKDTSKSNLAGSGSKDAKDSTADSSTTSESAAKPAEAKPEAPAAPAAPKTTTPSSS